MARPTRRLRTIARSLSCTRTTTGQRSRLRRFLKRNKSLLEPDVGQDLGIFLVHRQHTVARITIIGDGLALRADMVAIMAAETAGRIVVTKMVWMHAPGHVHFRENIAKVDLPDAVCGLLNERAARVVNGRIFRMIKTV